MSATVFPQSVRQLPTGRSPAEVRARLAAFEQLMEGLVRVPLLGRRVGLDSALGLVPGVGDALTGAIGLYLVWEARNLGLPRSVIGRMLGNLAVDTAVGAVPVAGDLFDFVFRSNTRNLKLLRRHLDAVHPAGAVVEGQSKR